MNPQTGTSTDEPAHDILAAEEFAVPARDPALGHGPVDLPEDPTGIEEPHDVLAAEEFALPAGGASRAGRSPRATRTRRLGAAVVAAVLLALAVRRVFALS